MKQLGNKKVFSVSILLLFLVLRYVKHFYAYLIYNKEIWNGLSVDLRVSLINYTQMAIVFIFVAGFFKNPFEMLGLNRGFTKGMIFAFLFNLIMLLGFGFMNSFQVNLSFASIHRGMILAGFSEEFMYRAFLFGLLYFYCGWGFFSAVLIPSFFFGIGHLYQANNVSEGISIFMFTALANAGFAWFYLAWDSLWMVVFLHGFMDITWDMFAIQTNVTGNAQVNLFRFGTLIAAIIYSRYIGKKFNRIDLKDKLWKNVSSKELTLRFPS